MSDMSPYFESPYITGILLLPTSENRDTSLSQQEIIKNTEEAEILGLKGIENNCDIEKINAIFSEDDI